ncbi:MAG: 2',3'-cyclic-nucleotide 2'-phosphodiesterase (5'-nucleotidase family), partial [Verrucomicrobiales bacterium]
GDFLSPSVASSVFQGREMIETLNALPLTIATVGNHEFDFGVPTLLDRMKDADFNWVIANISDADSGQPIGGAKPWLIKEFGDLKVGFIGLCLTGEEIMEKKKAGAVFADPFEVATIEIPKMKEGGADVIVAMTHLTFADDVRLAQKFPDIDLILGGHEHFAITSFVGSTLVSKADSDARTVARHDLIRRGPDLPVERHFQLVPIDESYEDKPEVADVVKKFEVQLAEALNEVVGKSEVQLSAVSEQVRSREVNLGNFFADAMREATDADVAIVNSGSIRSNTTYGPGDITRRDLLAMHPFGGTATKVEIDGATLKATLENGVSQIGQAAGRFPQVSGIKFKVEPSAAAGARVSDIRVLGKPINLSQNFVVSINDYMLAGGDGYEMLTTAKVLLNAESSPLLVNALEERLGRLKTIAPKVEGRIEIGGAKAVVAQAKTPLILDTDMGIDSVLGMLYLLKAPEIDLLAITVVNGISEVVPGAENARRICALTGNADLPIGVGQPGPLQGDRAFPDFWRKSANTLGGEATQQLLPVVSNPGTELKAEEVILQQLRDSAEPVSIVAMGPLTNVAQALKEDPSASKKIEQIIVMGGAIEQAGNVDKPYVGIHNSVAEWNFYLDPDAAKIVLESGVKVLLLPLDATHNLPISPEFVERIAKAPRDQTTELLLGLLKAVEDGIDGGWFFFWDTLAAVAVAQPEILATYPVKIEIEIANESTLGQSRVSENGVEVRVSEEVNPGAFEEHFLDVVLD